ncbi:MAG: hypothetical protein KC583_12940, partial [Myxococcales bacterium]|nr:hypothetical protein [Myxococcales bacterium]
CVFGDFDDPRVDRDPELSRWGEAITPNQFALARQFALSDNFYTEVQTSDAGHLLLTGGHLTEFVERTWIESSRLDRFFGFQLKPSAQPSMGNLFTHLIDHGVSIRIFGEIVGMFVSSQTGPRPVNFSDQRYPGGAFFNMGVKDETKARHVIAQIEAGELAQFTFLSLPNDHTYGTDPGKPTPESMVSDNDYAVGLVVEALSKSPFWPQTAVIILEDDPQGCEDHVDAHRSILLLASPYAKRGHVSKVHGSFISVFATINAILGVPPMGRPDAAVPPLYDMFTADRDLTPFEALPRQVPDALNPPDGPGGEKSARMNFGSPDREPDLAVVLDAYRLWKMGRISRAEADRRVEAAEIGPERREMLEEEAEEESTAFDLDWPLYQQWRAQQGLPPAERAR